MRGLRVSGGVFRSRGLRAPRGVNTRPTSDRVREAIFSILASEGLPEPGGRVLDLYAGTGALGIEAISRGAASAVLVESSRDALAAIADNLAELGIEDRVAVIPSRVERALPKLEGRFDVVFMDPPYADVRTPGFAKILAEAGARVAPGGALLLEHDRDDAPPATPGLVVDRVRPYGDTAVTLFRVSEG